MNSFYSPEELNELGLKSFGQNVLISKKCSIYSAENITIGNHVRIDDFCILSGNIELGSFIHISAYTALYGRFGIKMDDYSGLSPRCTVFSASDDFSGNFLIGPLVDSKLTNITGGPVLIGKYVQIGTGSILLPNIIIKEGVAVGAMSLINNTLEAWGIYYGIPARRMKERSTKLLQFLKKDGR